MSKCYDKEGVSTLIARNKIVESHATVILTVNCSSLPASFLNIFVGDFYYDELLDVTTIR